MNVRPLAACRLACALVFVVAVIPLAAQSQTDRPLIALYEPSGLKADTTLTAALGTVADSVELDLACLQRFEVRRLPAVDPVKELAKVRSYCQANRIDQAIMGSGSARSQGGYAFRLMLYDRRSDSVTLEQEGSCSGALDMFDTTDVLVAALLDKLSGTHLLFGSLTVQTVPEGATVSLNGKEVGPSPLSLRGLPVGTVSISARSAGWEEGSTTATVQDNQVTDATLTLAHSVGTVTLDMPKDAYVKLRAAGVPERILWGPSSEQLPTGSYELEASCPGLSTVRQSLTVARNAISSVRPWGKGYLEVSSEVEGAAVAVDGVPKGTVPLVVEVDPGALHRVELSKDKYEVYRAELSVAQARKVSFQAEMTLKTGSVRVETTPVGTWVQVDDREGAKTPCTFRDIQPGLHTVTIDDLLVDNRYYTSQRKFSVEVSPDEETTLSQTLVPGKAHLGLVAIPPGGVVTIDGSVVDTAQLTTAEGIEIPAGVFDLAVTAPSGQAWKQQLTVGSGGILHTDLGLLTASLARRTIKVDGNTDDWEGLLPIWEFPHVTDKFPTQPGTAVSRVFMCRDDRYIYVRMDFDNGTPLSTLTKEIKGTLCYVVQIRVDGAQHVIANVNESRQWGTNPWLGIWNEAKRSSTTLSQSSPYGAKGSTLELGIPVGFVQGYLKEMARDATIQVADQGETDWIQGWESVPRTIDFGH